MAEVVNVVGEVEGRDCIIPDDMIDTGGTMTEAVHALKRLGAGKIYICATHAAAVRPGLRAAVEGAGRGNRGDQHDRDPADERKFEKLTVLSIAPLLAKAIGYTHSDLSVSSLFD